MNRLKQNVRNARKNAKQEERIVRTENTGFTIIVKSCLDLKLRICKRAMTVKNIRAIFAKNNPYLYKTYAMPFSGQLYTT